MTREAAKVLEPGYDGDPVREYEVRDPDGDGKRKLTTTRRVDRLQWLKDEGHIEDIHLEAGNYLREDWEGCRIGNACVSWENIGASRRPYTGLADNTLTSLDAFSDAWEQVPVRCRPPVGYVVLENHSKDRAASLLHTHHRAILPYLLIGLDFLAHHYKLTNTVPLVLPARKW